MTRTIKTLAVLLLLAVMPLRGLAAATVGFCAMGHQQQAAHADAGHGHGAHQEHRGHDDHGAAPAPASTPDCNVCVEHCSSASFAVPAPIGAPLAAGRATRIVSGESFSAGFVPDHLDPPPLAL
jgi:hypothetical protein